MNLVRFVLFVALHLTLLAATAHAETMRMAVTTSFHNSGLAEKLLPAIREDTGIDVHLLVVGTGQALKLGRAGDVDALLVHSRKAEEAFVAQGHAPYRRDVMYNDFVFIGPATDPAAIADAKNAREALARIRQSRAPFVSRGDDSGTHRREVALWAEIGDPQSFSSDWYREVGAGMGAALNTASAMNAYILSDRASWLNFANKGDLKLLFSGDAALFNQYGYLPVSAARHPHVNTDAAGRVGDWLTGEKGQKLIADYRLAGEQLFVPNAAEEVN